jgi:hypothetical protein
MKTKRRVDWDKVNTIGPMILSIVGVILGVTAIILNATGHR